MQSKLPPIHLSSLWLSLMLALGRVWHLPSDLDSYLSLSAGDAQITGRCNDRWGTTPSVVLAFLRRRFCPARPCLALVMVLPTVVLSLLLIVLGRETRQTQGIEATLYVARGSACGSTTTCCSTVQAAVDAAGNGDVVRVAAGTDADTNVRPRNDVTTTGVVTQVVYISKTVAIRGGYTTTNWTISNPVVKPPMWTRPSVTPTEITRPILPSTLRRITSLTRGYSPAQ